MEKIKISPLKKEATRICLGTWAIGGWLWGGTEEQASVKTIHQALNLGINIIDTAPVYGFGKAEEIIGKALKQYGHRENVILATKVGLQWKNEKVSRNCSRQRILQEIDDSLKRLQTDYIDLYQIHWPDQSVPFSETAETLLSLMENKKILSIGISNFSVAQMKEFQQFAPIHISQQPYNLFERRIEKDIFPYTEKSGITTLAYGALCRGLLSGKVDANRKFKGDDIRKIDPKFQPPLLQQYLIAVKALDDFAKTNYKKNVLALAVRWILDKGHTIALWGARHPDQLKDIKDINGWKLDAEAMHEIDSILNRHIEQPIGPEFMAPPEKVIE